MKNRVLLIAAALFFLFAESLHAQAPQGITYQAIVRDGLNAIATGPAEVRFTIRRAGVDIYQEEHSVILNDYGLFTVAIGKGNALLGNFSTIDWSLGGYNVRVEVDKGSGYENLGIVTLESVPYSLYAEKAGSIDNLNVALSDLSDVAAPAPMPGEVLVWDGTMWVTGTAGTTIIAGAGIQIINDTLTNTGDLDPFDDINIGDPAGGDLGNTFPAPSVVGLRGNPISSNVPLVGQILKWSGVEWVPSVDNVTTGGGGAVNVSPRLVGDGTIAVPLDIAQQGAFPNQILKWNGANWAPTNDLVNDADSDPTNELQVLSLSGNVLSLSNGGGAVSLPGGGTTYTAGQGISILGTVISNTGDTNPNDDITTSTNAGGDLFGLYPAPEVVRIRGVSVSSTAPQPGQIMKYNGVEWIMQPDEVNDADSDPTNEIQALSLTGNILQLSNGGGAVNLPTYIGGTGISVVGNIINNTGDTNPNDDITNTTAAGGDLQGTYPNPLVRRLQGFPIANVAPGDSQVLAWNGAQWAPFTDPDNDPTNELQTLSIIGNTLVLSGGGGAVGIPVYTGGTGISVSGTTINNTGDLSNTNELQTLSLTGTTISLSNGGGSVNLPYTGGAGINITGSVITNTGDTNAADDITTSTFAGGDLSGQYPSPSVEAIQGNPVSSGTPDVGEIMEWNGTNWTYVQDPDKDPTNELQTLSLTGTTISLSQGGGNVALPYTGGTGINVTGAVISNTGDTNANDDVLITTNAGGDVNGVFSALTVAGIQNRPVANIAPGVGQVLKFNGSQWVPAGDANTTYSAGTGITIDGSNTIINTGDTDATDDITTSTFAGGDLSGLFPNVTISRIQGNPVLAGTPGTGQVLAWNGAAWAPATDGDGSSTNELQTLSLTGTTISLSNGGGSVALPYVGGTGISITGATIANTGDTNPNDDVLITTNAGGDLTGVFSNLSISRIQGNVVSAPSPLANQVLKFIGGQWVPANDENTNFTAGAGINISGNVIVNTGDLNAADDVLITDIAGGDATGVFSNLTITGLRGRTVATTAPNNGEVLKFNNISGQWEPGADNSTAYTAGTGINITGTVVTNTGDTNPNDDITTSTAAAGDLSGTFPTLTLSRIQGNVVSAPTPAANQVLKFVGGQWVAAADANTTYTAGTGLSLTGTTFINTGDTNPNDDITTSTAAAGDVSGTFPTLTVAGIRNRPVSATTPNNGEVLKYNNVSGQWEPAADAGTTYTAGAGINITGTTVSNTGVLPTTAASGDVGGSFGTGLSVNGLRGNPLAPGVATPVNNNILRYNSGSNSWVLGTDENTTYTAGAGLNLVGTTFINTGDTNPNDDITTSTAAAGDVSGTFPTLQVTGLRNRAISATAPSNGEVLKYNSVSGQWEPAADMGTNYTAGAGLNLVGTTFINTGDINPNDDITTSTAAAGDVSGTFPTLQVTGLRNRAISATAPSNGEVLKYNSVSGQWEPAAESSTSYTGGTGINITGTTVSNTGVLPTTAASGDVSGSFGTALTVDGLFGNPLAPGVATPANNNILRYSTVSSSWVLGTDENTTYTAGTGLNLVGTTFVNTGDTDASDDITTSTAAAGDVTGTFPTLTVAGIRGRPVTATTPSNTEILKYNSVSGQWELAGDENTTYTAGAGLNLVGTTFINTGDTNPNDDITTATAAAGDVSGTFPTLTVGGIQGIPVLAGTPINDQVLKYNSVNARWEPGTDNGNAFTAGTGISIDLSNVITNTGVLPTTAASGDVSGTFGTALTVDGLRGNALAAAVATPAAGNILEYSGTEWVLGTDENTTYTAGTGLNLVGTTFINTGDTNPNDDITTATAAAGDVSGTFPTLTVAGIRGRTVSTTAPSNGEVLKYNSVSGQWEPAAEVGTLYSAGTGIDITGTTVSNTGVLPTTAASGDVSGTFGTALTVDGLLGNPLAPGVATPANNNILRYNTASSSWILSTDNNTTYTAGTGLNLVGTTFVNTGDTDASDDITTATAAAGDVTGTFPTLTVAGIRGRVVSTTAPSNGEVLKYNSVSGQWEPAEEVGTLYSAGTGLNLVGTTFVNTGDTDASDDITTATAGAGDVSGTFPSLTVAGIRGRPVTATTPDNTDILKYNSGSGQWELASDENTTYAAGAGMNLVGTTFVNTGDTDASDDITTATAGAGDVSGTFPTLTVAAIQGIPVLAGTPGNDQVLKYNTGNNRWEPGTDNGNAFTAGTGINIDLSNVITNTGVLPTTAASGDVSGTFGTSLLVGGLRGNALAAAVATPAAGNILEYNGTEWTLGTDENTTYTAGTGINITGTTIANTGVLTTTTASGDVSGSFGTSLSVTGLRGRGLAGGVGTPADENILKYDIGSNEWILADDENTTYTAGAGLSLTGTVFANTGDTDASDDITTATAAAGDVSGTFPTLTVSRIQGNPVANAAPSTGDALKWNGSQWAPAADANTTYTAGAGIDITGTTIANTGVLTTTAAPGDVSGSFGTSLTVTSLRGRGLAGGVATPADENILKYDIGSNEWILATDQNTTYTAGAGLSLTGTVFANTGDTDASDDITTATAAAGDLTGTFPTLTVAAIRGTNVVATAPVAENVLRFDGTNWAPGTVSVTELAVDGDMIPDTDNVYDLGSVTNRYQEIFAANGVINTSDFRYKEKIEDLDYGLDEILRLRPVSYSWKDRDDKSRKIGLIAQEILPVVKEVVKTSENEGPMGVYYSDLIPVLIKGMQEQQELLEGQKDMIDRQQMLIDLLEKRIAELETK